jgi:hypothetical protein
MALSWGISSRRVPYLASSVRFAAVAGALRMTFTPMVLEVETNEGVAEGEVGSESG